MTRIGILSDTHGYWDDRYLKHFENCDEIWHAGDIGSWEVAEKLAAFRPLRAVRGNIDGGEIRLTYPEITVSLWKGPMYSSNTSAVILGNMMFPSANSCLSVRHDFSFADTRTS